MNGNQDRVATMVVRVEGIDSVQRVAAATTFVVAAKWPLSFKNYSGNSRAITRTSRVESCFRECI